MSDLTQAARKYAQKQHLGQTRKGKDIPYFEHVAQIARTLSNYGFRDEVVAAGYLHDVTEDVEGTHLEDIECEFNEEVAQLVDGASEHDKSASWDERKQHTLDYLENEASMEEVAIKAADKIDNVRSINQELAKKDEDLWSKFNAPRQEQNWYHTQLLEITQRRIQNCEDKTQGNLEALHQELKTEIQHVFQTSLS